MSYWKFGCNWDGGNSFYDVIKQHSIVIGVKESVFEKESRILITEGFLVKAIAIVLDAPKEVVTDKRIADSLREYIPREDLDKRVTFAKAKIYELNASEQFEYKVQRGLCEIHEKDIIGKVDTIVAKSASSNGPSYWIYAPGEGGKHWEEFYKNGIMAIGWDYLGDLRNLSKEEIAQKHREHDGELEASKKNNAISCFCFAHTIKVGDVVFAKIGRDKIIGAGIVKSDYIFDSNRKSYTHVRKIDWKVKGNWTVPESKHFAVKTLTNITKYKNFVSYFLNLVGFGTLLAANNNNNIEALIDKKCQIILYGPPGTGKTFNTKNMAVAIIDRLDFDNDIMEYDELSDEDIDDEEAKVANEWFIKIESFIKGLSGTEVVSSSSMKGYYSLSTKINRKIGLVWLAYPSQSTGFFTVHLRKEISDSTYPKDVVDQLINYKKIGWGGYPSFIVKNSEDVERAITLIKYAYENL